MGVLGNFKSAIKFAAAHCGLFDLSRLLTRQKIRIVVYHQFCGPDERTPGKVSAQMFERQISYLKARFHVYSLSELAGHLINNTPIQKPAAAITIDDGHLGCYRWAYPVLVRHEVPATLYVVSALVERGGWFWFDKLDFLRHRAPALPEFSSDEFPALLRRLRELSVAECEQRLASIAVRAGCALPDVPPESHALENWTQLKEMVGSRLIDIGAHTVNHQVLAAVGPDVAWQELSQCREDIQNRVGLLPQTFCFPNGLDGDYGPEHLDMLAEAGYTCAVASHFGLADGNSHPFALPRVSGEVSDFLYFRKLVDGFESLQRRMLL